MILIMVTAQWSNGNPRFWNSFGCSLNHKTLPNIVSDKINPFIPAALHGSYFCQNEHPSYDFHNNSLVFHPHKQTDAALPTECFQLLFKISKNTNIPEKGFNECLTHALARRVKYTGGDILVSFHRFTLVRK